MALAKTDNTILELRGRFGGVYFKKDAAGQHIQAMPRHVRYTRSALQQGGWGEESPFLGFGVSGFSGASSLWLLALLAFFGAAWAAYAIANKFRTKKGEEKGITGYNWFIHYALAYPEMHRPPFWEPPHAPGDLPQVICTFQGTWHYEHAPPNWPYYCPSGYYWFKGWWGDCPYFGTDKNDWFLWFSEDRWVLGKTPGIEDPDTTFYSDGENIIDYYRNPVQKKWAHVYQGGGEFPD